MTFEQEILKKAKEFNGSIENIEEFFEHVKQLEECSNCKRVFWDRLCPDCVNKIIELEIKEYRKKVLDAIDKLKYKFEKTFTKTSVPVFGIQELKKELEK